MSGHDHHGAAGRLVVDDAVDDLAGLRVETRRRLVQKNQISMLDERLRQQRPLTLPPGQLRQPSRPEIGQFQSIDGLVDGTAIRSTGPTEDSATWPRPHRNDLADGDSHPIVDVTALRNVTDTSVSNVDRTRRGLDDACKRLQHGRFAGTVVTDESGDGARLERRTDVVEGNGVAVPDGQGSNRHGFAHDNHYRIGFQAVDWLLDPFAVSFVQRALWAGMLVSILCALVGTWVVLRGMAFLSDAVSHGMLPGVAIAYLLSANLLIGAAVSAVVMIGGVAWVSRNSRLSEDTGIGLLFVGMLALGVVIVSRARSFAVDLTSFLFGDVLSATYADLVFLVIAAAVALVVSVVAYRPFVAMVFDERKAHTFGFRPRLAHVVLLALVVLAVVASFRIVGTLLVFGLLVAPSATAYLFGRSIVQSMIIATLLGWSATITGLLVSWHANTAAGATIAGLAVLQFFLVAMGKSALSRTRPSEIPNVSEGALSRTE